MISLLVEILPLSSSITACPLTAKYVYVTGLLLVGKMHIFPLPVDREREI
uniref:Uncharacterized protein n=1 Tax=Marseillevirus LCMAC103 TaxID=2506604 RepID=A0A481YV02_9VIRU|nr:MAG: hypothetical protein LCMAC103_00600 [Marseillevirus LCMAC103]